MGFKARNELPTLEISVRPDLKLRPLSLSDAEELFAVVDSNREHLREWLAFLDVTTSAERIQPFLNNCVQGYANGTSYRFALVLDGAIGGAVGLEDIAMQNKSAKIGYWQSKTLQGRGCVTAAVRAVLEYGFETRGLNLIEIRAATGNTKSRAVAERVGMKLDGVLRQRAWLYDHYEDLASYSLLAEEWRSAQE